MKDPRFGKINELFINYSLGNFDYKIELSSSLDEIDAFISNINMLGEELKATTISKNYFNNIFDSVSDMLFVLDQNGCIQNINQCVSLKLEYPLESLELKPIDFLLNSGQKSFFKKMKTGLNMEGQFADLEAGFVSQRGKKIPVICSLSYLPAENNKQNYILIVRDITKQKEMENEVIHSIVNTQEKERRRFAVDLHDSIGQKLNGIIHLVESVAKDHKIKKNKEVEELLSKSVNGLTTARIELRRVCFDLMPKVLERFGLRKAIYELREETKVRGGIKFQIAIGKRLPKLDKQLQLALFRIIQEFISNSFKYAQAKTITLQLRKTKKNLLLILTDDGIGFDLNKLKRKRGMGLKNVQSRVASYNGEVEINSKPGEGTSYSIALPLDLLWKKIK